MFIPGVATQSQPPSSEAVELAKLVGVVIDEYREQVPDVTSHDILIALELAKRGSGVGPPKAIMFVALALLVVIAVLGVVFTALM